MKRQGIWVTDFIRYHVLIRVFDGDVDAWIALAERRNDPDVDFLHWLKKRLGEDATLLPEIQSAVNESGLWPHR